MYKKNYNAFDIESLQLRPIQGRYYHPFIHKLVEMLNRGDSPTIAIVGKTNTGKSMKALRLCEILQHELNLFQGEWEAEENLVYEVLPFLKTMRDIPTPDTGETINEHRKCIIFDEGGVNLNSKDHMQGSNRGVDEVLQTMRIKNCLYIFVTPDVKDLDTSIRGSLDFLITVKDQGFAFVNDVEQVRDRLDHRDDPFVRRWGYWTPELPAEELIDRYRNKEYPHKEGFVEERIDDMEKKERQQELEDAPDLM